MKSWLELFWFLLMEHWCWDFWWSDLSKAEVEVERCVVNSQLACVCLQAVENPSCAEIRDVLTAAGMNVYVEVKLTNTHTSSGVKIHQVVTCVSVCYRTKCTRGSGTGTFSSEVVSEFSWSRKTAACVRRNSPPVSSVCEESQNLTIKLCYMWCVCILN